MIAKRILTAVLLFFLAANVAALVTKHLRHGAKPTDDFLARGDKVLVYYFHAHERCESCRYVEAFSREAVETGFAQEAADGRLAWQAVDIDEPANRHFDQDYELGGRPAIVLAKLSDGKCVIYEILPVAWGTTTAEMESGFVRNLQTEIRDFTEKYKDIGGESAKPESRSLVPDGPRPTTFAWGLGWALWLGIFTAITPCTLVANVAAVSYIGRRVGHPGQIVATGVLYAVGQTLAYAVLGFVLVAGLLANSAVSSFLHRYMNELLGPLLILTAMFLLGLIDFAVPGPGMSERLQRRLDALGLWGAFLLGVIFALTFCPVSGTLFFLQLVPEAAYLHSPVALPALYGLGNTLPVVAFALMIAFSVQTVGKIHNRVAQFELWLRRLTGVIFLAGGTFFALSYVFDVPFVNL